MEQACLSRHLCIHFHFDHCSLTGALFQDREPMTSHLESQHGIGQNTTSQACPLCLEEISGGRDLIILHFARHSEEIALAIFPESDHESDQSESDAEEAVAFDVTPASSAESSAESFLPYLWLNTYGCTYPWCYERLGTRSDWG
ncbi:hypothetical protein P153DRAFT_364310 [Dothidotthia symphoricarpi CBS 119687]|uniref:C2H2-type domain-containing protein n=1 Tax=Dothidotthia symphoricarpi CBS 119687 TaxID=1392245 RepID=A0A6A6AIM9_9PLEO|nr:uncharacterized protein P153DRAFT_364310 [Dothidotthia symphoricarpi CBS 119687]KAF2131822.1 hypothetical protein P153DRAFT_364310 [Dothidotthia symphoricarpi CBS 119687]